MQLERYEMNNDVERIPYIAYESALARNERTIKRLIIALVLSIVLMFASNAMWAYCWMQYDYTSEETTTTQVDQDGKGTNVYGDGNEVNGADNNGNSAKKTQTEEKRQK